MTCAGMLAESRLLDSLHEYGIPLLVSPCAFMATQPTLLGSIYKLHSEKIQQHQKLMAFNRSMSNVRVSVEWIFADIVNYFKFIDFKKDFKIDLCQVGKVYIVSAMLRNVFLLLLFFVDNYKWSTTKKHCLWGKLSTTKCENFKLSMTRSSLVKKESCSVVETNC